MGQLTGKWTANGTSESLEVTEPWFVQAEGKCSLTLVLSSLASRPAGQLTGRPAGQ